MAFTKIAAAGIGSTELVTLHSLEVLNNATVGGVLTYEDVTNVDSIGIVTARAGVLVGSGITLSKDGDIFATGITTVGTGLSMADNVPATFGDSGDLKISHNGTDSLLQDFGTGNLKLSSNGAAIVLEKSNGEPMVRGYTDGAVELFHDNSKKLETSSDGVTVDGKIIVGNSGTPFGNAAVQAFIQHGNTAGESGFSSVDTTSVAAGVGGEIAFHGKYNTGAQDYAYTGHIRGIKENATAGNTACALTFHTRPNAVAPQERLRITGIGSVGINANNPNALLEVRGTAGTYTNGITVFSGNTTHSGSNAKNGIALHSFGDALAGGLSSNLLYWNSSSPVQSYATRSSGEIKFSNTTSSSQTSEIKFGGYYKGTTTFVERLRIDSSGNVLIPNDTGRIQLGTGQDLQLIHDGSASKIIAKPEFMLQSDEITFRNENGSATHAIINSSGQIGIGTNVPGAAVSVNGSVKFASGTSVGGPAMLVQPHDDITLVNDDSATLNFGARFTGIVIVSGKNNDTAAGCWALASASSYSSDGVYRIFLQNHAAANTTDLTITSPSHGGTHQYKLNQTGSATKTYKVIAFGIKE